MDNDKFQSQEPGPPPRSLVVYVVASTLLSVAFFLLALMCPLNVVKDDGTDSANARPANVGNDNGSELAKERPLNDGQDGGKETERGRKIFFLTTTTMFIAGMTGGCLSNLRRIIQHSVPGPFNVIYSLSYYLRPLIGGVAGIVVFFLLLGGVLSLSVGSGTDVDIWMTLMGRAPFITFALLAGFASKEFSNKLTDLSDSLFALSKRRSNE